MKPELARRLLAEGIGTALLVAVVIGSGIAAQQLSPGQVGLQLLENSTATVLGLAVLILVFGPVSGAHFNPVVSAVDWLLGRRTRSGLTGREVLAYIAAQVVGAIAGAVLANLMFGLAALQVSTTSRNGVGLWVGEMVATAGLITVIFALARTGRAAQSAAAVAGWIGAAYWFTSSTSFANPAVTIGRVFSDTFAGITPSSAPGFIAAQLLGALAGLALVALLYPDVSRAADTVVVPPHQHRRPPGRRHRPAPRRPHLSSGSTVRPTLETAMTETYRRADLAIDQRLALKSAASRLAKDFTEYFGVETIDRFLHSSYDQFAQHATIAKFLPLLAERFARQRLRALMRVEGMSHDGTPTVLFLCTHNAGRSQMAMGFFTHFAGDQAEAWSGGSEPASTINPPPLRPWQNAASTSPANTPNPGPTRSSAPPMW